MKSLTAVGTADCVGRLLTFSGGDGESLVDAGLIGVMLNLDSKNELRELFDLCSGSYKKSEKRYKKKYKNNLT